MCPITIGGLTAHIVENKQAGLRLDKKNKSFDDIMSSLSLINVKGRLKLGNL